MKNGAGAYSFALFANEWEVLKMKIRLRSPNVKRGRTVSAVGQATSQKAREAAHPQLFRSMLKQTRVKVPLKVVHPPFVSKLGKVLSVPEFSRHPAAWSEIFQHPNVAADLPFRNCKAVSVR